MPTTRGEALAWDDDRASCSCEARLDGLVTGVVPGVLRQVFKVHAYY